MPRTQETAAIVLRNSTFPSDNEKLGCCAWSPVLTSASSALLDVSTCNSVPVVPNAEHVTVETGANRFARVENLIELIFEGRTALWSAKTTITGSKCTQFLLW